jgi:hypothetical protein
MIVAGMGPLSPPVAAFLTAGNLSIDALTSDVVVTSPMLRNALLPALVRCPWDMIPYTDGACSTRCSTVSSVLLGSDGASCRCAPGFAQAGADCSRFEASGLHFVVQPLPPCAASITNASSWSCSATGNTTRVAEVAVVGATGRWACDIRVQSECPVEPPTRVQFRVMQPHAHTCAVELSAHAAFSALRAGPFNCNVTVALVTGSADAPPPPQRIAVTLVPTTAAPSILYPPNGSSVTAASVIDGIALFLPATWYASKSFTIEAVVTAIDSGANATAVPASARVAAATRTQPTLTWVQACNTSAPCVLPRALEAFCDADPFTSQPTWVRVRAVARADGASQSDAADAYYFCPALPLRRVTACGVFVGPAAIAGGVLALLLLVLLLWSIAVLVSPRVRAASAAVFAQLTSAFQRVELTVRRELPRRDSEQRDVTTEDSRIS